MIDFPSSPSLGQIFNSGSGPIYIWDGVAWSLTTQVSLSAIALLQDQKASGTAGGATSVGWQTVTLNTEVFDAGNIVTLSSNTFVTTVDAILRATATIYATGNGMLRLFNVTDNVAVAYGTGAQTLAGGTGSTAVLPLEAKLLAGKVYRLDVYTSAAQATNGRGGPSSNGAVEVYASATIQGPVL